MVSAKKHVPIVKKRTFKLCPSRVDDITRRNAFELYDGQSTTGGLLNVWED